MWDWVLEQYEKFTDWLSSLWPENTQTIDYESVVQSAVQSLHQNGEVTTNPYKNYNSTAFKQLFAENPKQQSISQLRANALSDIKSAEELLKMPNLKKHLTFDELCKIIYIHRDALNLKSIESCIKANGMSMAKLAKNSVGNALMILKSSLISVLDSIDLINIYSHHAHQPDFIAEVTKPKGFGKQHVPTLSDILIRAVKEDLLDEVRDEIKKSPNLDSILKIEKSHNALKEANKESWEDAYLDENAANLGF